MEAEVGIFKAFYASPIQHPILLWIAAGAALVFSRTARDLPTPIRRYTTILVVLSLLDAWLSSTHIYGIGSLRGSAAIGVPIFFVLAGDYRYLFLVVAGSSTGKIDCSPKKLLSALGITLAVPILTEVFLAALPESLNSTRMMFLIYELSFVCLTLALLNWHPNLKNNTWLASISRFVVAYYSLWALSDILILFLESDLGYLLRAIPNLLYYGGLIAAIAHWAPKTKTPSS
jgi:hypothetical protein